MPRSEREPTKELDSALLAAYTATFIPRLDQYPQQLPDGKFITVHRPLNSHMVAAHLRGQVTLGAYALDRASMARWVCFDADAEAAWEGLKSMYDILARQQITSYLEPSRRGGHLWLFTPELPGMFARRFAKQLLSEQQLEGIEIYPKQDMLISGAGSLVRLPLGVHRKSGRVYHFINRDGQPLAPTIREQVALLSSPARIPMPFILGVLARVQQPFPQHPKPTTAFHTVEPTPHMPLSERLKGTISVLEFVSRYVQLDRNHTGFCPFHDDQHQSFAVNEDFNYWHCFAGCGGGSIIDFWMKWREHNGQDSSFTATIKDLRSMLL